MELVVLAALVIKHGRNIACDEWYVLDLIKSSNVGHKRELYVFLIQYWVFWLLSKYLINGRGTSVEAQVIYLSVAFIYDLYPSRKHVFPVIWIIYLTILCLSVLSYCPYKISNLLSLFDGFSMMIPHWTFHQGLKYFANLSLICWSSPLITLFHPIAWCSINCYWHQFLIGDFARCQVLLIFLLAHR